MDFNGTDLPDKARPNAEVTCGSRFTSKPVPVRDWASAGNRLESSQRSTTLDEEAWLPPASAKARPNAEGTGGSHLTSEAVPDRDWASAGNVPESSQVSLANV